MTDTWVEHFAASIKELVTEIQAGRADSVVDELDLVIQKRKAERDKWQPLNDLMEMLRTIENSAAGSLEQKAYTGTDLNHRIKPYLEHPDASVRGLAWGVRLRLFTDLLGLSSEQVGKLKPGDPA